jgi:hypothetical protein
VQHYHVANVTLLRMVSGNPWSVCSTLPSCALEFSPSELVVAAQRGAEPHALEELHFASSFTLAQLSITLWPLDSEDHHTLVFKSSKDRPTEDNRKFSLAVESRITLSTLQLEKKKQIRTEFEIDFRILRGFGAEKQDHTRRSTEKGP